MSKISCDVTRDLMASYLDGVCSEESKGLVEEHLQECDSCKRFVEQVQEQDLGKDAVKVDFFKRVRHSANVRAWLGVALALTMSFIGHPHILYQSLDLLFYYIVMPIFMLIGAIMPLDDSKESVQSKREWIIPLLGFGLICAALILTVMALGIFSEKMAPPRPMIDMGAWFELRYTCIAVLSAVLLIILFLRFNGRKSIFIISQNIAWLGLNLSLFCNTLLYHIEDPLMIKTHFGDGLIILILEFVVMTALMLAFYHNFERVKVRGTRK